VHLKSRKRGEVYIWKGQWGNRHEGWDGGKGITKQNHFYVFAFYLNIYYIISKWLFHAYARAHGVYVYLQFIKFETCSFLVYILFLLFEGRKRKETTTNLKLLSLLNIYISNNFTWSPLLFLNYYYTVVFA
jgi:hypothetical protein